eukprot:8752894-Pyramimonas_sp.AAC.1
MRQDMQQHVCKRSEHASRQIPPRGAGLHLNLTSPELCMQLRRSPAAKGWACTPLASLLLPLAPSSPLASLLLWPHSS